MSAAQGSTEQGRALLAAALGERDPAAAMLLGRAADFDAELGAGFGPFEGALLSARGPLRALLARRGVAEPQDVATRLASAVAGAEGAARLSLEAVLARALAPQAALVTLPTGALFSSAEAAALAAAAAAELPPVSAIDLRQRVGRPIRYAGYLCVILKVTRLCNLRCTYCHDWAAEPGSTVGFPLLLRLVGQALRGDRAAVDFVLHGGEPLMMGRRRLLQLLALQAHLARPNQVVRTHLQTNGTLLDARWLRLLALFGLRASVSLDGDAALHDATRPDARGRGTWRRARDGIAALQACGLLSGVLMVVGPAMLRLGPERLLCLLEEEGLDEVSLLPERPAAGMPGGVGREAFVGFLAGLARARAARGARLRVRELDAAARLLAGEPSGFCELAGNCVGAFVTVDAAGDVAHCDKYVGDAAYVGGNLWQQPLDAILAGPRFAAIAARAYAGLPPEEACRFRALCQGWCPHERYVTPQAGNCCGLAPLFSALAEAGAPAGAEMRDGG